MRIGIVFVMILFILLTGCKQDMPEPESLFQKKAQAASVVKEKMVIRHLVQGKQMYVECVVPNVTFTEKKNGSKKGKVIVTIDGKRFKEYYTAAFVVKNLKQGVHHVKIDIVGRDNENLGLKKQFYVTIP